MDEEILIQDVTAELVGERQQEYYDGIDAGMRQGTSRVLKSESLAQLALGLTVHKAFNEAMAVAAHQRETDLASWKAEAALWRSEYERISAEYSDFVKAVARLVK